MRIGRFLVQGVDVWLNNPRRPLEASGTSGMKAAANGGVNASILDGWWDEGFDGDNGWAIGGREINPDEGAQDWADVQDLYRVLEDEVVPAYYERDAEWDADDLARLDAPIDGQGAVALLHDPDAPRVRGAAVPPGGRRCRRCRAGVPPPTDVGRIAQAVPRSAARPRRPPRPRRSVVDEDRSRSGGPSRGRRPRAEPRPTRSRERRARGGRRTPPGGTWRSTGSSPALTATSAR